MPTQTLLWTALPNGMGSNAQGRTVLRLSAVLSPRLTPDGRAGNLKEFPDFVDWPARKIDFAARFFFGPDPTQPGAFKDFRAARAAAPPAPRSDLWKALFNENTRVRPYKFEGLAGREIRSYSVRAVVNFIREQYTKLASASYAALPPVADLLDDKAFGPLGFYRPCEADPEAAATETGRSFLDVRDFHQQTDPEAFKRLPKPPSLDFHDVVACVGEYPALMRALGLVVDLEVEFSTDLVPGGRRTFAVAVVPAFGRPGAATRTQLILPRTAYQLDPARSLFLPRPSADSDIADGMLKLGGGSYDVVQLDVDGAAQKLLNFAYNLQRTSDERLASVDTPAEAGVPTLRSSGISVIRDKRADQLGKRLDRGAQLSASAKPEEPSGVLLNGEDVVRGYRVDVLDVTPERAMRPRPRVWRSLCRRDGEYRFTATGQTVEISDEGIVSLGVTQAPPKETAAQPAPPKDDLCLHESLFNWDGWSLCAPRPGKSIGNPDAPGAPSTGDEKAVERRNDPPAAFPPLGVRFRATKGTLPRLRFGRKYRLRARAVDLAGNSVAPADDARVAAALNTDEFTYVRYEPVSPPVVFTAKPAKEGESLERVVIRSDIDPVVHSDIDTFVHPDAGAERHFAPPKCGQLLAETHGMFDGPTGAPRKDAYQMIVDKQGAFEPDTATGFVTPDRLTTDGDGFIVLPYLPDPLARGALLRLSLRVGKETLEMASLCDFGNDKNTWPEAKPWRLRLVEHGGEVKPEPREELASRVTVDRSRRVVTVALRKAEVAKLKLSSQLGVRDLDLLGVWQWVSNVGLRGGDAAQFEKVRDAAASGFNWLLTPPRELVLVHAVRRPLLKPDVTRAVIAKKFGPGNTGAALTSEKHGIAVDGKSTSKIDLLAEWHEKVDDPSKPFNVQTSGPMSGLDIKPRKMKAAVMEIPVQETDTLVSVNGWQEFGDTKFRSVSYTAVATTRFREYFNPEGLRPDDFTQTSDPTTQDIISSARPAAPRVVYVVPAFEWKTDKEKTPRTRGGGWLRVYLERPWYSSGDGELLGVVVPSKDDKNPFDNDSPYVTRFGLDPLRVPPSEANVGLTLDNFDKAAVSHPGLPLPGLPGRKVAIVGFKPFIVRERNLWACDIRIKPGAAYYPFVRLALVRYQPNSLVNAEHDLRLSNVVTTDFAQLAPDRTLSVVKTAQSVTVTLTGAGYAGTSDAPAAALKVSIEKSAMSPPNDISWTEQKTVDMGEPKQTPDGLLTWTKSIDLPKSAAGTPRRLVVREYESYKPGPVTDDTGALIETGFVGRLVYADSLPL